jgi:hypothetical protein
MRRLAFEVISQSETNYAQSRKPEERKKERKKEREIVNESKMALMEMVIEASNLVDDVSFQEKPAQRPISAFFKKKDALEDDKKEKRLEQEEFIRMLDIENGERLARRDRKKKRFMEDWECKQYEKRHRLEDATHPHNSEDFPVTQEAVEEQMNTVKSHAAEVEVKPRLNIKSGQADNSFISKSSKQEKARVRLKSGLFSWRKLKVELMIAKCSGVDEKKLMVGLSANNSNSDRISKFGQTHKGLGDIYGGNTLLYGQGDHEKVRAGT